MEQLDDLLLFFFDIYRFWKPRLSLFCGTDVTGVDMTQISSSKQKKKKKKSFRLFFILQQ
jgi:hypothetical protein